MHCNPHHNFARSLPSTRASEYQGPVIDNSLSSNISIPEYESVPLVADLKTQVAQWIRFEKEQVLGSHSRRMKQETIFTVWFSLWDIWHFSKGSKDEGSKAVAKAMDSLFEQLDILVEQWPYDVKVIVPEAIDPTFLPGWQAMRTGPSGSDSNGDDQRKAVRLVDQWNEALGDRGYAWERGQMFIYSTNEWLLDQVREQQLILGSVSDGNGLGKNGSPWINVQAGCVGSTSRSELETTRQVATRCAEPHKYLFW